MRIERRKLLLPVLVAAVAVMVMVNQWLILTFQHWKRKHVNWDAAENAFELCVMGSDSKSREWREKNG